MQSKKMLLIGSYSPENGSKPEIIDRDYYRQGWIFKDEDAFQNRPDDVRGTGLAASRKFVGRLESKWRNCLVSTLYRLRSGLR